MTISRTIRTIAFATLACLPILATAGDFVLQSEDLRQGESLASAQVYDGFGCTGSNRSPILRWSFAPAGTKSFAVTVYDPDAPTGSGWWHWLVYNIPSETNILVGGAGTLGGHGLPRGAIMGRNDFGANAYGGACPPPGHRAHRYLFAVHALKVERINLPTDASAAMIGFMINSNSIATARILATFGRPSR
jgi:Raf kinase inhibitor-like YbhB/YbcL family protein